MALADQGNPCLGSQATDLRHAYEVASKLAGRTESASQVSLIDRLQPLLRSGGKRKSWFNWSSKPSGKKSGAYIYGDVGTGKTMIMDLFYDLFPAVKSDQKLRRHFHQFMLQTHSRSHELRQSGVQGDLIIERIGSELGKRHRLICLDEFQVVDIADAMILKGLLESLFKQQTTLLLTSNRPPDELYLNGIQRNSFLPCIELIKDRLDLLRIEGQQDYRLQTTPTAETDQYYRIGSPMGLEDIFSKLTEGQMISQKEILTMGRVIQVPRCSNSVALFNFDELFRAPLSAVDYLAIAKNFNVVLIENVPGFHSTDLRTEARRFVTFIDILYDLARKLAIQARVPLSQLFRLQSQSPNSVGELELADELNANRGAALFTGAEEHFAVARTCSRIHQMTSQMWWKSPSQPEASASG